jgi:hypothetical protein
LDGGNPRLTGPSTDGKTDTWGESMLEVMGRLKMRLGTKFTKMVQLWLRSIMSGNGMSTMESGLKEQRLAPKLLGLEMF